MVNYQGIRAFIVMILKVFKFSVFSGVRWVLVTELVKYIAVSSFFGE